MKNDDCLEVNVEQGDESKRNKPLSRQVSQMLHA